MLIITYDVSLQIVVNLSELIKLIILAESGVDSVEILVQKTCDAFLL